MIKKLYVVVYKDDVPWVANGILYVGTNGTKARQIHEQHNTTSEIHEYVINDNSIMEVL